MNTKRIVGIGVAALAILWIVAAGKELLAQGDNASAGTTAPNIVIAETTPSIPTQNPNDPIGLPTPIDGPTPVTTVDPATDPTPPAVTTVGPTPTEGPAPAASPDATP